MSGAGPSLSLYPRVDYPPLSIGAFYARSVIRSILLPQNFSEPGVLEEDDVAGHDTPLAADSEKNQAERSANPAVTVWAVLLRALFGKKLDAPLLDSFSVRCADMVHDFRLAQYKRISIKFRGKRTFRGQIRKEVFTMVEEFCDILAPDMVRSLLTHSALAQQDEGKVWRKAALLRFRLLGVTLFLLGYVVGVLI